MIDGRPECLSGRLDVTRSLMVPQPLKAASVAANAQNCESRFIIGTRPSACKVEASLCIINTFYRASRFALFPCTFARIESYASSTAYDAISTAPCWNYSTCDE